MIQKDMISFSGQRNEPFQTYMEKFVLPECKKGKIRFFDDAQRVFIFCTGKQMQIDVAAANEDLLCDISAKKLLWLAENFRIWRDEYCAYVYGNAWNGKPNRSMSRRKLAHLTDSQYYATLKLGTFSSNGYYRQQCMKQLPDVDGSLPFLILRMNDWVEQIRESAYTLSQKRLEKCGLYELFQTFPMIEKVKHSCRRDGALICTLEAQAGQLITQKIQTQPNETLDQIPHYEIWIKNAIYRFLNNNQVLNRDQMERLLTLEPTGYGQMLLILGIFKQYGYDRLQSEQYLRAKSAVVRYHTLVFRYEQEHSKWDGLDAMLLDPSRRVRDYAAYILKKHTDINIITFYRKELERQASKITLYSIGEHGTKAELEVIKPYLADECESICKAALHAYGKLAQSDGKDVYWKFLFDKRQVLARQAYRCIRKYEISYGVQQLYEAYLQKRLDFPADYLLMLLLEEPFWKRLPYLLMLNCDEKVTEKQQLIITAGIFRGYLYSGTSDQQTVNYMYSSVTNQQADMIRHLLERNKEHIPESVRKKILFDLEHISKG